MKQFAAAMAMVAALISGCAPSKADIQASAKKLTQEIIQTSDTLKDLGLVVDRVDVINGGDKQHEGMAQVEMDGEHYPVPLSIVVDGDKVMVNVKDGAFLFTSQKIMRNAMAEAAAREAPGSQQGGKDQQDGGSHGEATFKDGVVTDRPGAQAN